MQLTEKNLPSNKVGLALVVVVLIVAGTIFASNIEIKKDPIVDLKNVELVVERKTDESFKAGDSDNDGLSDWLEEFYKTDIKNADTDGDGTPDGEEVTLDRDPAIAGPNDPLITRKDLINTEADLSDFVAGTMTDKVSVELFSEYLMLKKEGTLKPEDEAKLVDELSRKVAEQASLRPQYSLATLSVVESTKDTITIYGDRVAQVALSALTRMDSHKNLQDMEYLAQISKDYKTYSSEMAQVRVPTVSQQAHLELVNYLYNTGVVFDALVQTDADPLASMVIMSQYQAIQTNDQQLYTTLAEYFKNNDIIFDTESTIRFWQNYKN